MHALFNGQNWLDLFQEDSFTFLLAFLILGATTLLAMLFFDQIQRWRSELEEHRKWLRWNRN